MDSRHSNETTPWTGGDLLVLMSLGYLHDLNNTLTGVVSFNELALEELNPEHPACAHLLHVRDNARRASKLCADLGRLLAPTPESGAIQDLNQATLEALALLTPAVPRRVELVPELATGPLLVRASGRELRHAIFQGILIMAGTLTGKGVLRVRTLCWDTWPPAQWHEVPPMPGPYAGLGITDAGTGPSREMLRALWLGETPPKPWPYGTGASLKHLRDWVRDRGGGSGLALVPGSGSILQLGLPRVSEEALEARD